MKAFVGFLVIVIIIGNGVILTRRRRRSGQVQSYGHPTKDNLLLLGSGIVVAAVMSGMLWWMGPRAPRLRSPSGQLLVLVFLMIAAGISYLANRFLRRG
jgi:hypothetical protein